MEARNKQPVKRGEKRVASVLWVYTPKWQRLVVNVELYLVLPDERYHFTRRGHAFMISATHLQSR